MILTITQRTILKLRQEGFYPDEMLSLYFVLKAMKDDDIDLLDGYDDFTTSKRAAISYQTLYRKGMIDKSREGSRLHLSLTDKGRQFLSSIEPELKGCEAWIDEWNALFPKKNQNGVLQSDKADCLSRMNAFLKKFKHSKEVVFAATKSYLIEESSKNFQYTRRSMYFIEKRGEGSLLAAWCNNVLENKGSKGELNDGTKTTIIQTVN